MAPDLQKLLAVFCTSTENGAQKDPRDTSAEATCLAVPWNAMSLTWSSLSNLQSLGLAVLLLPENGLSRQSTGPASAGCPSKPQGLLQGQGHSSLPLGQA